MRRRTDTGNLLATGCCASRDLLFSCLAYWFVVADRPPQAALVYGGGGDDDMDDDDDGGGGV